MASTYSSLKIQLMTTGENSGTWGNVTNVNLGTAIEEAIVGSADVAFSGVDVTLTLSDTNTTQTARNMRLNLTGTSGGARNLTVPAIEKIYVVRNGLADTVTVRNATGSTVAIPAGRTMWVYSTGTGVVDVVTHLSSLTLSTVLPVTSGGTGTNTSTGSGNVVLATSPTLTTPNIGTPSAGTLTNCTGLPLTTGVTGVLPNANTTASSSNGASTIVARDASGNFTANTITANVSGNVTGNLTGTASNATVLQTARTIALQDGATGTATSFNGSANISIPVTALNASVLSTGTVPSARISGAYTGITEVGTLTAGTWSATAIALTNGGTGANSAANARTNLDVPSRTGANASGTWSINITGSAASVSSNTSNGFGTRTISASSPTGGASGDIWYQI